MWRTRFRTVFILLLLILLIASAVFGVLTYWLGAKLPPVSGSGQGSEMPSWGVSGPETRSRVCDFGGKSLLSGHQSQE